MNIDWIHIEYRLNNIWPMHLVVKTIYDVDVIYQSHTLWFIQWLWPKPAPAQVHCLAHWTHNPQMSQQIWRKSTQHHVYIINISFHIICIYCQYIIPYYMSIYQYINMSIYQNVCIYIQILNIIYNIIYMYVYTYMYIVSIFTFLSLKLPAHPEASPALAPSPSPTSPGLLPAASVRWGFEQQAIYIYRVDGN